MQQDYDNRKHLKILLVKSQEDIIVNEWAILNLIIEL